MAVAVAATNCASVLGIEDVNQDDDLTEGASGQATGGSSTGGVSGKAGRSGGSTGGTGTGGSGTGGSGTGGSGTGGSGTGGSDTGGTGTGGSGTGGSNTGGSGPGGSDTGGSGTGGSGTGGGGSGGGPDHIVINEIFHNPPGADEGCFIELFGPADAPLDGLELRLVHGFDGSFETVFTFDVHFIGNKGFFVLAQSPNILIAAGARSAVDGRANLLNSANTLVLVRVESGVVEDAVAYSDTANVCPQNTAGEGPECADAPASISGDPNRSIARDEFSADTDDNFIDFFLSAPTPGAPNPTPDPFLF